MKKGLAVLVIAVLIIGAVYVVIRDGLTQGLLGENTAAYKAVTLADNTSFFGHIIKSDSSTVTLSDVFYIRTTAAAGADKNAGDAKLELVKPSNELLGPSDEMVISRRYILTIQELKADSKVVAAINAYHQGGNAAPTVTPTPAKTGKVEVRGQ